MPSNNSINMVMPITVPNGGTGASSFTNHGVIVGSTTSSLRTIPLGSTGQVLMGVTGSDPVFSNITSSNGSLLVSVLGGVLNLELNGTLGISSVSTNSGVATGAALTLMTPLLNLEGTAKFSAALSSITLRFSDSNRNTGIGTNCMIAAGLVGGNNTCYGYNTGALLTLAQNNVLIGSNCIGGTLGGNNTAVGTSSYQNCLTGTNNVILGYNSGNSYLTLESSNILIGSQIPGTILETNVLRIGNGTGLATGNIRSAFISGIAGSVVVGSSVIVSAGNQLGVGISSARFKENITDMGERSNALYNLRPVCFMWKKDAAPGLKNAPDSLQYGLIAEEAYEHIPHAVNVDNEGNPLNINYQDIVSLLINEIKRLAQRVTLLESKPKD